MATLCLDHFCSEGLGGKGQITVIVKMFKYALSVTGGCVWAPPQSNHSYRLSGVQGGGGGGGGAVYRKLQYLLSSVNFVFAS